MSMGARLSPISFGAFALGTVAGGLVVRALSSRAPSRNARQGGQQVPSEPTDIKSIVAMLEADSSGTHRICVIGAGAFGTSMAYAASRNGHSVIMWMRDQQQADAINSQHKNPRNLSEYELPTNISATTDLAAAVAGAVLIIHALPCQMTPGWLRTHRDIIPKGVPLCITSKGLYLPTKQLLSDAITEALGRSQPLTFLSGPSFAAEIMQNFPTMVVVAGRELYLAVLVQKLMSNLHFRVYTSQDIVGVQLGGALKNPLAVGAGMLAGLGFGVNTLSAAVTRSAAELTSLCTAMGGKAETIAGLAGFGDLMLTCTSSQSRNYRCGTRLTKGDSIEDILKDMTVEGVPTSEVAVAYADLCGLDLPIFRSVKAIIAGEMKPNAAMEYLMGRPLKPEHGSR
eukprot:TRINITY_DN89981_c0_g1_i1.p1 TRINITY_DN89981_c0_g1~~TRINITY_DN89981_c0_g1_i1.p1  ORF type:complete len:398 (+),score=45.31 TRINITY_DN89981_c0_g1_i1:44-1237(+)